MADEETDQMVQPSDEETDQEIAEEIQEEAGEGPETEDEGQIMQLGAPKSDSQIIPPAAATDEPFPKQPNIPEEGGGEKLVEEPPEPRAARIVSTIGGLEVEGMLPVSDLSKSAVESEPPSEAHPFGSVLDLPTGDGKKKSIVSKASISKGSIKDSTSGTKRSKQSVTKDSSTKTGISRTSTKSSILTSKSAKDASGISVESKKKREKKGKQKEKAIHAGLNLRANYKIIIDGNDVTPKTLYDNTYQGFEEKQLIALDLVTGLQSQLVGYSTGVISGEGPDDGAAAVSNIFHDPNLKPLSFDMHTTDLDEMTTLHYEISTKPDVVEEAAERAPSPFNIPKVCEPKTWPKTFSLVLKETETIFLLDMQSETVEKGSFEAAQVEADNEMYEYLTEGKGRKRKMTTQETQTPLLLTKSRNTLAERSTTRNSETFASEWEMLDTYQALEDAEKNVIIRDPEDSISPHMIYHSKLKLETVQNELEKEAIQAQQIISKPSFKNALLVIERLLASNVYEECQKKFRGLIVSDPTRLDIKYNYRLDLLWTFYNSSTVRRAVTAVKWNPVNHDVLAVGYGRFFYGDPQTGLVSIWNIKNPTQPEREFHFKIPVTSIAFSKANPHLLAIGFYDGDVLIIDISCSELCVVSKSDRIKSRTFEPIWQIKWYSEDYSDAEFIMCTGQDGRISRYQRTKTTEMVYSQLMRVCRLEGEVQGVHMPRRCISDDVNISRYPAALVLKRHPTCNDIYFIGTDEGCVYKCSINYPNQHLAVMLAHTGPVFAIEFSPFISRIYVTCGGDWYFRLWAEGIDIPILSMKTGMSPVQGLTLSPKHSCIIACATDNTVQIWDLSRKMFTPSGVTELDALVTLVTFTETGNSIVVATVQGAVHTFTLEDMPFPPYYQGKLLLSCIKKALIGNPDLVKDLEKLNLDQD